MDRADTDATTVDVTTLRGRRAVQGGRGSARAALYMAALVAARRNAAVRDLYQRLRAGGRPAKVALTACMRKLLTILNAILRDGRPQTVNAVVGTRPSEDQLASLNGTGDDDGGLPDADSGSTTPGQPASNPLGLQVVPLTPQIARSVGVDSTVRGVVVASVDQSTDAGQKLKRGDVITAVNFTPVTTAADMTARVAAARAQGRDTVILSIQRQRVNGAVPVKIRK